MQRSNNYWNRRSHNSRLDECFPVRLNIHLLYNTSRNTRELLKTTPGPVASQRLESIRFLIRKIDSAGLAKVFDQAKCTSRLMSHVSFTSRYRFVCGHELLRMYEGSEIKIEIPNMHVMRKAILSRMCNYVDRRDSVLQAFSERFSMSNLLAIFTPPPGGFGSVVQLFTFFHRTFRDGDSHH